jgi:hypothetical protein
MASPFRLRPVPGARRPLDTAPSLVKIYAQIAESAIDSDQAFRKRGSNRAGHSIIGGSILLMAQREREESTPDHGQSNETWTQKFYFRRIF